MEQVVELFGRYRSREIAFKELNATLKTFLGNHPQATRQGLGWLDLAQQRQPMPVTEFIQLRADMDYLLRSLALQSPEIDPTRIGNAAPRTITLPKSDAQSTVVQRAAESLDATVVNNAGAVAAEKVPSDKTTPEKTVFQKPASQEDEATHIAVNVRADDDATRIAAKASADTSTNEDATRIAAVSANPTTRPPAASKDSEATVVVNAAAPADERTVIATPKVADPTMIATPRSATPSERGEDATRVVTPREAVPKMPHSQRVPPRVVTAPEKTATPVPPAPRSASLVLGVVAGIAAAIVLVGGFALWKSTRPPSDASATVEVDAQPRSAATNASDNTRDTASNTGSRPVISTETSGANTIATVTTGADETETVMLQLEVVSDSSVVDGSAVLPSTAPRPSMQPIPAKEPVEPLPTDINGLLSSVKNRVDKGRLLPADDPNSATFAIKALIAKAPDSNEVSEARKILSQAHLELARQAREKGDLDAAQTHLDNAFDVRLMQ